MGHAFDSCRSLKEIDLTNWRNGSFVLDDGTAHGNYICCYCELAEKIDLTPVNFSNIALANYGSNATTYTNVYECMLLKTLNLPSTFAGHLNLRYNYTMTHDELVRIINALPTALTGAKLVITEMRYKLTTAEIAIATNKGYTVS